MSVNMIVARTRSRRGSNEPASSKETSTSARTCSIGSPNHDLSDRYETSLLDGSRVVM